MLTWVEGERQGGGGLQKYLGETKKTFLFKSLLANQLRLRDFSLPETLRHDDDVCRQVA